MDRQDYWLLDTVIDGRILFYLLNAVDGVELVLNRPWHGMTTEQLIDRFERLTHAGMLIAQLDDSDGDGTDFVPTRSDIVDALERRILLRYGVTPHGGAQWESLSNPNWDLFVDFWCNLEEGAIEATTIQLIDRYLQTQLPSYDRLLVPGSEVRSILEPWDATYWKRLPHGYSLHFKCVEQERPPGWRHDFMEAWYTNYWEATA
jgi:hypothetical protein